MLKYTIYMYSAYLWPCRWIYALFKLSVICVLIWWRWRKQKALQSDAAASKWNMECTCEHAEADGKDTQALLNILQIGNVNPIFVLCKERTFYFCCFAVCSLFGLIIFTFNPSLCHLFIPGLSSQTRQTWTILNVLQHSLLKHHTFDLRKWPNFALKWLNKWMTQWMTKWLNDNITMSLKQTSCMFYIKNNFCFHNFTP